MSLGPSQWILTSASMITRNLCLHTVSNRQKITQLTVTENGEIETKKKYHTIFTENGEIERQSSFGRK